MSVVCDHHESLARNGTALTGCEFEEKKIHTEENEYKALPVKKLVVNIFA